MAFTASPSIAVHFTPNDVSAALAADVHTALTGSPKQLSPKWLYDPAGCDLFDLITELDEYYQTRTESSILNRHAPEIAELTRASTVVELGSGTSEKTRFLLDALRDLGTLSGFLAVDVAESVLRDALAAIGRSYPGIEVAGMVGDFERHLGLLPEGKDRLVVFLGGTIGNLDRAGRQRFLRTTADQLAPGEWLLLGTDLVKDPDRLIRAYDDSSGVTAAFDKNILTVINRELGGHFDLEEFDHVARWDASEEWIEMRLRARRAHAVAVDHLGLTAFFHAGEEMRTEISAKFRPEGLDAELAAAGFEKAARWTDPAGDFAVTLAARR